MDVFLIPLGTERFELYCEPAKDPDEAADGQPGLIAQWRRRFSEILRMAEERKKDGRREATAWTARLQDRMMAWIAERIAEQRLLWYLQRQTQAVLHYPDDITGDQALALAWRSLERDYERHLRWLVIDAAGLLIAIPLIPVPGPNLLGYYFLFRVGGHYLSMRGARQGRHRVQWTCRACAPLTELRGLAALAPSARARRVRDIAERLHLPHLPLFFARLARPNL